jgi:hypothetical protein
MELTAWRTSDAVTSNVCQIAGELWERMLIEATKLSHQAVPWRKLKRERLKKEGESER